MEVIGGIIGVLLVFFVLIIVNAKTKRHANLGGEVCERPSKRHCGGDDGVEYSGGKMMPKINVSANKSTLYDEKGSFVTTDVKMSIEGCSGDTVDNQIFDEDDDFGEFSLRDGVLYSIILENKVV